MNVLITGGSGLIGQELTKFLKGKGHKVAWLSRSPQHDEHCFLWNIQTGEIDFKAIEWADAIVHLAGASVAGKRWTPSYKKEIVGSRVLSTALLKDAIGRSNIPPHTLISASAIGIYGAFENDHDHFVESSPMGNDFLADVTKKWEDSVNDIDSIRKVVLRIGIVLSYNGGAFQQMTTPIKYGLGAAIGSGNQLISWIHIKDLIGVIDYSLTHLELEGTYNAVAPEVISNRRLTQVIAKIMKRPLCLPAVPMIVLKLLLGEFANFVTLGTGVSSEKIMSKGYSFQYPEIKKAVTNLLAKA